MAVVERPLSFTLVHILFIVLWNHGFHCGTLKQLTILSRMNFPIHIDMTSLFQFFGVLGGKFILIQKYMEYFLSKQ